MDDRNETKLSKPQVKLKAAGEWFHYYCMFEIYFCGLLPLRGESHNAIKLSEGNNRIRAHIRICFGTSSVVQRLPRIAANSLECYSELARDHVWKN